MVMPYSCTRKLSAFAGRSVSGTPCGFALRATDSTSDVGGSGAGAYGEAVATIEALALDKLADYNNTICTWNSTNQNIRRLFTKQAIPMVFPETTPLHGGLSFPGDC